MLANDRLYGYLEALGRSIVHVIRTPCFLHGTGSGGHAAAGIADCTRVSWRNVGLQCGAPTRRSIL
jgi:hypothetical protein